MERLPGGLEGVYDRMLFSIERRATKYIRKTLRWLTYSIRPLRLNEVTETFVVDYQASPRIDFERRMDAPTDLLSMCSSLVSSEDETLEGAELKDVTSTVRLVHYSLREYLVSDRIRQGLASEYGMQE